MYTNICILHNTWNYKLNQHSKVKKYSKIKFITELMVMLMGPPSSCLGQYRRMEWLKNDIIMRTSCTC